MTSPAEIFVTQLARASRRANRLLSGLSRADRDDVIADAIAWCWEHREEYSLVTSIETWFVNAVRHALERWQRGESRQRAELVEDLRAKDDPEYNTVLADSVRTLAANMDELDRAIVKQRLHSKPNPAVASALGVGLRTVERRLERMKSFIPESAHAGVMLTRAVTPPKPSLDDYDYAPPSASNIDKEIEKLDLPPPHGKDCPPCWRCKWFEGYLPGAHISVRMEIEDAEVRAAVASTEAQKIIIAQEVRDGDL